MTEDKLPQQETLPHQERLRKMIELLKEVPGFLEENQENIGDQERSDLNFLMLDLADVMTRIKASTQEQEVGDLPQQETEETTATEQSNDQPAEASPAEPQRAEQNTTPSQPEQEKMSASTVAELVIQYLEDFLDGYGLYYMGGDTGLTESLLKLKQNGGSADELAAHWLESRNHRSGEVFNWGSIARSASELPNPIWQQVEAAYRGGTGTVEEETQKLTDEKFDLVTFPDGSFVRISGKTGSFEDGTFDFKVMTAGISEEEAKRVIGQKIETFLQSRTEQVATS